MSKKPFPLEPLGDQVILIQDSADDKSKGGIIIPDKAKEKPKQGTIMAVGPGKRLETGELIAPNVETGQKVIFQPYAGNEVKVEEETYLILTESDILARVRSG